MKSPYQFLRCRTRPFRWLNRMIRKGNWLPDEIPFAQLHFSQFGEDLLLQSLFKGVVNGFFVDIGAFDPVYFSNTYLLSKRGWKGINVEPNPNSFERFRSMRPNDINSQVAVSDTEGIIPFKQEGPISKIVADQPRGHDVPIIEVNSLRLDSILDQNLPQDQKIDLMTIDCEGHDHVVLGSNDWSRFRPQILLVEEFSDSKKNASSNFLESVDYCPLIRIGLTNFYVDHENPIRNWV